MMREKNIGDSDSDDSDFIISSENLSNESSISENESTTMEFNELSTSIIKSKSKVKKKGKKKKSLSRETEINIPEFINTSENAIEVTHEKERERTDSLWNDFLQSTGTQSKNWEINSHELGHSSQKSIEKTPKQDINIEINKNQDANSTKTNKLKQIKTCIFNSDAKSQIFTQQRKDLKRKGLSNILGNISKKSKLNTLEKSKQDWNRFKEEHNLNEEITNFNRGKNGYLERQDFLQRTDSRQFEIEKELRNSGRRKAR